MKTFTIGRASFSVDDADDLSIEFAHWCGNDAYVFLKKDEAEKLHTFLTEWLRPTKAERAPNEPRADQCEVCDKPLPPIGEWSMPSCPDCQHMLDGLGEMMADLADREQTIKADWIGRAINLICSRPAQPPAPEWRPHDGVSPAVPQNDSVIPIEIGVGKIRIATCWSDDDPQKVVRELVIYDDGGGQKSVGTLEPEHCGRRAWDVGRILARIRIVNADGAHVLLNDLQKVIENARQADSGLTKPGEQS